MDRNRPHQEAEHIFRELLPGTGMTERPEQIALCHRLLDAMLNGKIALCDAGTGIGKTHAFLVAGILFLRYRKAVNLPFRPVIVSTSSIALQKAVQRDYLPALSDILLRDGLIDESIRSVIRKGKRHYVCPARLEWRLIQVSRRPTRRTVLRELKQELDISEVPRLSNYDRKAVCVPDVCVCRNTRCRYHEFLRDCMETPYAFQICNHNLLLADTMHKNEGLRPILPDSCAVIADEAHKLPETVRQMRTITLEAEEITELIEALREREYLLAAEDLAAITAPLRGLMEKPMPEPPPWNDCARFLVGPERTLRRIRRVLRNELPRPVRKELDEVTSKVCLFCGGSPEKVMYPRIDETERLVLCASDIDLTRSFRELVWGQPRPTLLMSGTLAVGRSFHRFRTITGLTETDPVEESVTPSPFHYKKNCLLYYPETPADPYKMPEDEYYDSQAGEITRLTDASNGHALILCTSYPYLAAMAERITKRGSKYPVFALKRNAEYTVEAFRNTPGAVLLATGAAWEGFDFPGDLVSMLIIPRLPFDPPDPVKERQKEDCGSLHKFIRTIAVPDMQIRLRQGFGRAIRTETDTCVIAILDDRAVPGGRYYREITAVLPEMRQTRSLKTVREFFRKVKTERYFLEGYNGRETSGISGQPSAGNSGGSG